MGSLCMYAIAKHIQLLFPTEMLECNGTGFCKISKLTYNTSTSFPKTSRRSLLTRLCTAECEERSISIDHHSPEVLLSSITACTTEDLEIKVSASSVFHRRFFYDLTTCSVWVTKVHTLHVVSHTLHVVSHTRHVVSQTLHVVRWSWFCGTNWLYYSH